MSKPKVVEYHLVSEQNEGEFVKSVNLKIKEGWQPLGGPSIQTGEDELIWWWYQQAMVKYEQE